jgi:hypothetical protein
MKKNEMKRRARVSDIAMSRVTVMIGQMTFHHPEFPERSGDIKNQRR